AAQPCLVCARRPVDPHHIRFAQPQSLGRKVSDEFTVPLCRSHHRELHRTGSEYLWWENVGSDPLKGARKPWKKPRVHGHGAPGDGRTIRRAPEAPVPTAQSTTAGVPPGTVSTDPAASDIAPPAHHSGPARP